MRGIAGPVRPAQAECRSIGSQIGTVRTVQIAQAHDARRQRAGQHHRLGLEDSGHARLQGLAQLGAPLDGANEGKARVYEEVSSRGLGRAQCSRHRAREVLPRVPVVQQRVGLLASNVHVDRTIRTARRHLRQNAAELRAGAGDRQLHSIRASRRGSALVLERQRNPRAISDDLAVLDLHVELADFGDAQVAQRRRSGLDGVLRGVLPRDLARADDVRDAVDGGVGSLLLGHVHRSFRMRVAAGGVRAVTRPS